MQVINEQLSVIIKKKSDRIDIDKKNKEGKLPVARKYDDGPVVSCKAVNGPGVGKPCIFPFIVLGKSHTSCTLAGGKDVNKLWCSSNRVRTKPKS